MPVDTAETGAPVEADTSTRPDHDSASSERLAMTSREKLTEIVDDLVETQGMEIAERYRVADGNIDPSKMSPSERNLFAVNQYKKGFTDEEYAGAGADGKVIVGGLTVTTTDGKKVIITSLLSEEDNDEDDSKAKTYTARTDADDPSKPGSKLEVKVDAEEVVSAHMAATADSIASNFTDPAKSEAVRWRASGSTDDPSELAAKLVEDESAEVEADDPIVIATELINEFRTKLQLATNTLKGKGKLTSEERSQVETSEQVLGHLRLLSQMNGKDFVALGKFASLQIMIENGSEIEGLDDLQHILLPAAEKGLIAFEDKLINEAGATQTDIDNLEAEGLVGLAKNPDLIKAMLETPGIKTTLFGREIPDEEIINLLGGAITGKNKEIWDDYVKKYGKNAGIFLAILLAIPAAIAAGGVYVAANSMSAGRK